MTMTEKNVHKSRWGYYACDFDTFKKIKKIYGFYWKALHRNAEWERWNRKLPKNRVLRKWYRNDKRQKTGFEITGPKPEPQRYPVFERLNYIPMAYHALKDMGLIEDYFNARHPYSTPEEVKHLNLSSEQIDNMLTHLEKFES